MYRTIRYLHSQYGVSRLVSRTWATYREADEALGELPGHVEVWAHGAWVLCKGGEA